MKELYIIGDSISMGYGPFLRGFLPGGWHLNRKEDKRGSAWKNLDLPQGENNGDSRMVLAYVKHLLSVNWRIPALLLLNCGLHDLKRYDGIFQIPIESYRRNLAEIFDLLLQGNVPVVWISSTPVDDETHNRLKDDFKRYNADVINYNEAAAGIAKERGVPVIDLYAATLPLIPAGFMDHVHYQENVRKFQAEFIFNSIKTAFIP